MKITGCWAVSTASTVVVIRHTYLVESILIWNLCNVKVGMLIYRPMHRVEYKFIDCARTYRNRFSCKDNGWVKLTYS